MKKRNIIIVISLIAIVFIFCIFIYREINTVGKMNGNIDTAQSNRSEITFNGKKDEHIKIKYSSVIKEGTVEFVLADREGNVVQTFQGNTSSNEIIDLTKDDTYSLSVVYSDFVGKYSVKIER